MKCPHCSKDIRDCIIVQANAMIVARRRRANGTKLTSEQAQQMQARSVEAKKERAWNKLVND